NARLGIADQHAEVVGKTGKLVNFELGHEDNSGAFACIFGSLKHPNSGRLEFNRLARVAPAVTPANERTLAELLGTAGPLAQATRRSRPSRFLQSAAWWVRAQAADQPHPRPLAQPRGQPAYWIGVCSALHRHVSWRGRPIGRLDAGDPGR